MTSSSILLYLKTTDLPESSKTPEQQNTEMKGAANCGGLTSSTAIRSFCLNGDHLGAIA
jgi:hypothetical protein